MGRAVPFGFVIRGRISLCAILPHSARASSPPVEDRLASFRVGIILVALDNLSRQLVEWVSREESAKSSSAQQTSLISTTGAYYHVLNHPGGVGAGGRIRLELNDTHFEGSHNCCGWL